MTLSTKASEIKFYYCFRRKEAQQIEGFEPSDKKYGKMWEAAAVACGLLAVESQDYVDVLFDWIKPWPSVTQAAAKTFTENFEELRESLLCNMRERLKMKHGALCNGLSAGIDAHAFVMDPMQQFDPLFIYIILIRHGFKDLALTYEKLAFAQYKSRFLNKIVYKGVVAPEWEGVAC